MMTKGALRKKYITERKLLSPDAVVQKSSEIFKNFSSNFEVSERENVHLFLSMEKFNEVQTQRFIDYFKSTKARIYVPKMIRDHLISVELTENDLIQNAFGVWEPRSSENECSNFNKIITPLLYADFKGNRVGYGKGYYDSFFSTVNNDALKIGVGFFPPQDEVSDISEHDIPLDYLVTPEAVLSFNGLEKKSRK